MCPDDEVIGVCLIASIITFMCPLHPQNKEDQAQVVSNLKSISLSSSKLLLAAKALSADPAAPNLKSQLAAAARYVVGSVSFQYLHFKMDVH